MLTQGQTKFHIAVKSVHLLPSSWYDDKSILITYSGNVMHLSNFCFDCILANETSGKRERRSIVHFCLEGKVGVSMHIQSRKERINM